MTVRGSQLLPDLDDKTKRATVDVEGVRHEAMVAEARSEAARLMEEPVENLVVVSTSTAVVARRERFAPYIGAPRAPVAWRLTVTIKLHPEIVEARKQITPCPAPTGLHVVPDEPDEQSPEEGP